LVEGAVNISYTRIHAVLRDREFYSIIELNLAIKELLESYNKIPFQKKQHSRKILFLEMEKEALKPLPTEKYELKDYKTATVQKNCHVYYSADKNHYSVPYAHIGKKVKMVLCQNTVEIYHNQTRIALHARSRKAFHYTTVKEHMPVNHTYNSGWNPEYFITRAEKMGTCVKECIEKILERKQYAEQNYKSCRYSDESTPLIPEQSTPRFRSKVRHLFRSKVHQSNRPLSSLSKDDIFQS